MAAGVALGVAAPASAAPSTAKVRQLPAAAIAFRLLDDGTVVGNLGQPEFDPESPGWSRGAVLRNGRWATLGGARSYVELTSEAGFAYGYDTDAQGGDQPVRWRLSDGAAHALPVPEGVTSARIAGVNDRGDALVGPDGGTAPPPLVVPRTGTPYSLPEGTYGAIGLSATRQTLAFRRDAAGTVSRHLVGRTTDAVVPTGDNESCDTGVNDGGWVLWQDGDFLDADSTLKVRTPGGVVHDTGIDFFDCSRLAYPPRTPRTYLSDDGRAIGTVLHEDSSAHGAYWYRGRLTELATPPGGTGSPEPFVVNERGQVLVTYPKTDGTVGAAVWQGGRYTVLPVPAGAGDVTGVDLNDSGQAIGLVARTTGGTVTYRSVLWSF